MEDYGIFIEIQSSITRKGPHETNQVPIFLEVIVAVETMQESLIQLRRERQCLILKDDCNTVHFLNMTRDYALKFEKHLSELWKKANRKINALSRQGKFF